jgi:hypothetical protein
MTGEPKPKVYTVKKLISNKVIVKELPEQKPKDSKGTWEDRK